MILKPMLAVVASHNPQFPLAATPKIDGIRGYMFRGSILTRSGKNLRNTHARSTLEGILPDGADGELIYGNTFQETTSAFMSKEGIPEGFTFHMFDYVKDDLNKPYLERMKDMEEWYNEQPASTQKIVELVTPIIIHNLEVLNEFEEKCLLENFEGVMVRTLDGPYKCGRSTVREGYLLKIKRFQDAEAVVVGYEEKLHNNNVATKDAFGRTERSSHKENKVPAGALGRLTVRDLKTEIEFGIGTGLNDKQRKELWEDRESLVGKIVKYKSFSIGVKEAPRHPVFLSFRDKEDL